MCLVLGGAVLLAQTQDSAIRTNVPLVLLPVSVTTPKGEFIDGLTEDDFVVNDEGVPQKIHLDTSDTLLSPVSLVIAVQSSSISAAAIAKIRKTGSLIRPLITGERGQAAIIAYDAEVRVLQDFTGDADLLTQAFAQIKARSPKDGKLLEALAQGVTMLEARPPSDRRVLLFIGESRDRGSKQALPAVIEVAQRAGVAVYSLTYSAQKTGWTVRPSDVPPPPDTDFLGGIGELLRFGKQDAADEMARATGGQKLSFTTQNGLESALGRTGQEIHSQYLVSFAPRESPAERFHRVNVRIVSKPNAVVRSRPGYWPQK